MIGSLHDLGCKGPSDCTCKAVYLAKPRPKPKRRGHRDPVTPELREYILARDKGCLGFWIGPYPCDGPLEIDHVLNGGIGKRGPSIPTNLVTLCSKHHRLKTDNGREWRPLLLEYLAHAEEGNCA